MTRLDAHGLGVDIPRGWDGAVYRRGGDTFAPMSESKRQLHYPPILHMATFALPADRGDYGSGAIEVMGQRDLFVSVLEFDPSAAGNALFGRDGVPWPLRPDEFSPEAMRVPRPNQSGCQRFFRVGNRAFTLYVVIGSHPLRRMLVPRVNVALDGIRI